MLRRCCYFLVPRLGIWNTFRLIFSTNPEAFVWYLGTSPTYVKPTGILRADRGNVVCHMRSAKFRIKINLDILYFNSVHSVSIDISTHLGDFFEFNRSLPRKASYCYQKHDAGQVPNPKRQQMRAKPSVSIQPLYLSSNFLTQWPNHCTSNILPCYQCCLRTKLVGGLENMLKIESLHCRTASA